MSAGPITCRLLHRGSKIRAPGDFGERWKVAVAGKGEEVGGAGLVQGVAAFVIFGRHAGM